VSNQKQIVMKYFIIPALLLFPLLAFAQITTGTVVYEETITLNIKPDEKTSQFAHLLPSSQTDAFVLRFTSEEAHYTLKKEEVAPPPPVAAEGGFQIKIVRSEDNSAVYTDLVKQQMTEQRTIFDRPFRIEHQLDGGAWKLGNEQKEILGYTCFKATSGPDSMLVTAWFTPQVAVPVGPGTYGQLPGLILAVDYDDSSIIAISISTALDDPNIITIPKKGKVVTEAAFDRIQQEKLDELEAKYDQAIKARG
jgi:GLPGLI family protein